MSSHLAQHVRRTCERTLAAGEDERTDTVVLVERGDGVVELLEALVLTKDYSSESSGGRSMR